LLGAVIPMVPQTGRVPPDADPFIHVHRLVTGSNLQSAS
jgi:hypothetical protein